MGSEPRFFVLKRDLHGPYAFDCFQADGVETGREPHCPKCDEEIGMLEWLPPLKVELEVYGKAPGDFTISPGGKAIVSQRFVEAFHSEKLSGALSFEPVQVVKVVRKRAGPRFIPISPYFLMKVSYGRGALDEKRSRLRRTEPIECDECRLTSLDGVYGYKIEPGTWQGEDIFEPRGLRVQMVVSERFAEVVKKHSLTNIELIPTEQYTWDPYRKGPPPSPAPA